MLLLPSLDAKVGYHFVPSVTFVLSIWRFWISPRFVCWQTMKNDVDLRKARIKWSTSLGLLVGHRHLLQDDVVAESAAKSASAGEECPAGMGGMAYMWRVLEVRCSSASL